jgi:hypothetical protein
MVLTPIFRARLTRTRFKIGDWVQVVTPPVLYGGTWFS